MYGFRVHFTNARFLNSLSDYANRLWTQAVLAIEAWALGQPPPLSSSRFSSDVFDLDAAHCAAGVLSTRKCVGGQSPRGQFHVILRPRQHRSLRHQRPHLALPLLSVLPNLHGGNAGMPGPVGGTRHAPGMVKRWF
jgi:hypothetical protein